MPNSAEQWGSNSDKTGAAQIARPLFAVGSKKALNKFGFVGITVGKESREISFEITDQGDTKMCGVCERIRMIREGTNPYFVKELETGYVVIGDFQHFMGYTLFIYKDHVVELFDLEPAVRAKHLEEMTMVAQAVRNAFGAEKMNYECLGNGIGGAHIHWHLFPRKTGDLGEYGNKGKGPAWWYPMEKMYADSEKPGKEDLEKMKQQLLKELDALL